MGWERGYYYRVRKVDGRVVREYVGTGKMAQLVAKMEALERERRALERADRQELRDELNTSKPLLSKCVTSRSCWPMPRSWPRVFDNTSAANGGSDVANANLPSKAVPTDPAEINKLLLRAQKGDEKTLPAVRELLKQPHILELFGNAAGHAEKALIRRFVSENLAAQEGLRHKMDCLRTELAGPAPSALERLLAERIAECWLHVNYLEAVFGSQDNPTINAGMYFQKAIDRAHKRYLSAIKTLAVIRKLAVPVLQVNIAKKQVNVAGQCVDADGEKKIP